MLDKLDKTGKEFGKPYAGKPPVRFDEGGAETVLGPWPVNPSCFSTLHEKKFAAEQALPQMCSETSAVGIPRSYINGKEQ